MIDFEQVNKYVSLRNSPLVEALLGGFAAAYLNRCDKESKSDDEIDKEIYSKLAKLDTRLGTTAGEQLCGCLFNTLNLDIIKVLFQLKT